MTCFQSLWYANKLIKYVTVSKHEQGTYGDNKTTNQKHAIKPTDQTKPVSNYNWNQ